MMLRYYTPDAAYQPDASLLPLATLTCPEMHTTTTIRVRYVTGATRRGYDHWRFEIIRGCQHTWRPGHLHTSVILTGHGAYDWCAP